MDSLQYKVLEFDMPDDDFDPNFVPENGIQYLQQVAFERNRCPAVVVKPLTSPPVVPLPTPSWPGYNIVSDRMRMNAWFRYVVFIPYPRMTWLRMNSLTSTSQPKSGRTFKSTSSTSCAAKSNNSVRNSVVVRRMLHWSHFPISGINWHGGNYVRPVDHCSA